MASYFLTPDVYLCQRGDAIIFLDLHNDEYSLASGHAAKALRGLLDHGCEPPLNAPDNPLLELLEGGLLKSDGSQGRALASTSVEMALDKLSESEYTTTPRVKISHVCRFMLACASASLQLRFRSLHATIDAVRRRKQRRGTGHGTDLQRAAEMTSVFEQLRWFFPRDYLCLYDSLALIEFLAAYRIFPTWIFGVSLEPWGAHCWVQEHGFTFNEGVEEAANYTPIMAI
jgi:transglutaminase superfamily protein